MRTQNHLSTMREILNVEGGLDESCRVVNNQLIADSLDGPADPWNLELVKSYRFEGNTNPDDMAVLYVLRNDRGFKGALVNAYGPKANIDIHNFVEQVESHDQQDNQ